jgi:hypothetical protein
MFKIAEDNIVILVYYYSRDKHILTILIYSVNLSANFKNSSNVIAFLFIYSLFI